MHTRCKGVAVFRSESAEDVRVSFVECWVSLYLGYATVMSLGHESAIRTDMFRLTASANWIRLLFSGVESDSCLGTGKLYFPTEGRVYSVLREKHTHWTMKYACD